MTARSDVAVEQAHAGLPGVEGKAPAARTAGRCPRCGVFVQDNYLVCPYCALSLKKECPHCGKQIPPNWNACSFCGHVIVNIVPPDLRTLEMGEDEVEAAEDPSGPRGRCPQCDRLIADDSRYCGGCGLRIEGILLVPVDIP